MALKIHKKYPREIEGVSFYGKREDIKLRINYGELKRKSQINDPLHYHKKSTQFFLVIQGKILVEVDNKKMTFSSGCVYEITPKTKYRVLSSLTEVSSYIVIGTENKVSDRVVC